MKTHRLRLFVVASAMALWIAACGGGSSNSSMTSSMGSTQAPSSASGIINAFGSIFVNGMEYATDRSTSVVDGDDDDAPASTAALQVGMTVDVDSSGPMANRVRFTSAVRGEVDAIAADGSTITVLGQPVQITGATSFAGSNQNGAITGDTGATGSLMVGDYVTVSGFIECTSTATPCTSTDIVATLVYGSSTPGPYRVEGYAQVGSGAPPDSFTINGLTVDYTTMGMSATVCTPAPCNIANGAFVAVRSSTPPTTGPLALAATRIKATTQVPVFAPGATISLEGPVSQLNTTSDTFDLRGISIDYSGIATSVPSLANHQIIEVTGTVSANGTIVATAVTVERQSLFTLMAPLDSTPPPTATTLSVLGQTFTINSATRFVDWAQGVRPFNSSNFSTVLSPGDQLLVSGYATSSGDVATRVERIPTPETPIVAAQGVVTADSSTATTDTLTVGGVTATLGSTTRLWYQGAAGSPTLAGFLGAITVNSSVATVVGMASGPGAMTASRAAVMPSTTCWAREPY